MDPIAALTRNELARLLAETRAQHRAPADAQQILDHALLALDPELHRSDEEG